MSILFIAIRCRSEGKCRYRPAIVHGPHLRFDQFRIVLVLGKKVHSTIIVDLIAPRTESLHSPYPCSRLLRGRRSHLILLPSPYLPFSEPGGTKGSLSPQWIISRERPPTQEERPETSEMGLAPRLHQVQASGKFLQLAVPRALLREASSGRVVFSPNHEMGRATVLCDKTNVSVLRGTPVAVHLAQLRTSLAAVILEYMGLYCEASWSPGWGHLYVSRFTLVGLCGADQVSRSW